jgi:hypothetical protein
VVEVYRDRPRALTGPIVPEWEMSRDRITCRVLRGECCLRRGVIRRIVAVPIREGRTEIRLDGMDNLRAREAMAGPAIAAADIPDAAIRRQAGEIRHRVVLAAEEDRIRAVRRVRMEVLEAADIAAGAAEEATDIGRVTL